LQYCLYVVLSAVDYYTATNDTAMVAYLTDYVTPKLEHAHAVWGDNTQGGFYGWDDRLGSGFSNWRAAEPQAVYRHLCITAWRAWAGVLRGTGNATGAAHYEAYADAAIAATRAAPAFPAALGLHSAAEAMIGGWVNGSEARALAARLMSDAATVCSLSGFNTFFILQALAAAG
jgi:hypothetical protein